MEEIKNQNLLQPLIQTTNTNSYENDHKIISYSSNTSIILRLVMVIFVGIVSLWANYEVSKGFSITIVNEAIEGTFANKRFDLFYVSNDEATRLVLRTSKFVENILYPISDRQDYGQPGIKKQVKHVILQLSSRNLTSPIIVKSSRDDKDVFVVYISPSILEGPNHKRDMFLALQKGMARIWLWDGQGNAPSSLVNGMAEYITSLASLSERVTYESESIKSVKLNRSCWKSKDKRTIVNLLNYCEGKKEGFVRRLNKEMKNGWHEKIIDDVLGMPTWHLCETYNKEIL